MDIFLDEFRINILNYLIYIENINIFYLISILFFFSIIFLSLLIPGSFLVITNASLLGLGGFFISYISCVFSSILVYFIITRLFIKKSKLMLKYNFIEKSKNNLYTLVLCRVFIPFPICSYLLAFFEVNKQKYILATLIGIIPGTLSITLMFASIKRIFLQNGEVNFNLFKDPIFLISLIVIFFFIFISSFFKKKYLK